MPPAIPDKIPCDREDQLQREIEDLRICLDQEETEESWDKMQRALARFKAVVRGGGYRHESFVPTLKPLSRFISASMLSERGRLSAVAIELIATLVSALGKRFEPLVQGYMPTLLRLCQRPNKVVITRAHGCITTLIKQSRLSSIIPFLREAVKEKSVTLRVVASESANLCITTVEEDKLMSKITDIESIIKTTSRDPNPEVRKYARAITQEYRERFPDRYAIFISPLTPTTRKYLDIKTDNVILPKNPLPLKLNPSGPSGTSAAPKPSNPQVTTIKSSLLTGASTRNDQGAPNQKETIPFPPRPQSAASLRPRLVQMVPNEPSSNLRTGGARPVSVDLSDLPALTGNHGKSERPVSVLSELNHRLDLQRHRSRDAIPTSVPITTQHEKPQAYQKPSEAPEASKGINSEVIPNARQRQRSISQTSGRDEANRAMRAVHAHRLAEPSRFDPRDGTDVQPPRPRSALSTNHKQATSTSNRQKERPISVASDVIVPVDFTSRANQRPRPHTPNQATADSTRRAVPPPTVVTLPTQTPRAAPERPTVVYLPATEGSAPAQSRPAKTWSLSYQLELLNQRKRAEETKTTQSDASPGAPAPAVDTIRSSPASIQPASSQAPLQITSSQVGDAQAESDEEETPSVETPTKMPHPQKSLQMVGEAPIPFPSTGMCDSPRSIQPPATTSQEVTQPAESKHPTFSGAKKPISNNARLVAQSQPKAHPTGPTTTARTRVVSSASSDTTSIPVRAPSRTGTNQAPKSSGFVPKRTVKNSITQPTKSQVARAQVLMDERSATASKVAKESASSLSASTASKAKQLSSSQTSTEPPAQVQDEKGGDTRTSAAPRKRALASNTTSLVKSHAAKREIGLSQVKRHLTGSTDTTTSGNLPPRKRAAQMASSVPNRKPPLPKINMKPRRNEGEDESEQVVPPSSVTPSLSSSQSTNASTNTTYRTTTEQPQLGHGSQPSADDQGNEPQSKGKDLSVVAELSERTLSPGSAPTSTPHLGVGV
ncbi:hypothetical protein FRC20_001996 [Serendipita sp. 405]|nr:hypothetical protein FRC20_001996 [Serendipita sp. 405]